MAEGRAPKAREPICIEWDKYGRCIRIAGVPKRWIEEEEKMGILKDNKTRYESEVVLGKKYRDEQTGIEGIAVAVVFYQYACERITLEVVVEGKIEEYSFDAPRLADASSGRKAESEKTGGPERGERGMRPKAPAARGAK